MLSQTQYHLRHDYGFRMTPTQVEVLPDAPTESLDIQRHQQDQIRQQDQHHQPQHHQRQASWQQEQQPFSPVSEQPQQLLLQQQSNGSDGEAGDEPQPSPTELSAPGRQIAGRKNSTNNPVRKRTSRACDSCNQLRTKCDGKHPCSHCTESGLPCEYARVPKKRGKVSKKDLARQAALREKVATESMQTGGEVPTARSAAVTAVAGDANGSTSYPNGSMNQPTSQPRQLSTAINEQFPANPSPTSHSHRSALSQIGRSVSSDGQAISSGGANMDGAPYQGLPLNTFRNISGQVVQENSPLGDFQTPNVDFADLYMGMGGLPGQSIPLDSMEFSINSPSAGTSASGRQQSASQIKHPVLMPLLPFLKNIMSNTLAFELLEHFFTSASPEFPHPASPYHITTVFRKRSFLGQERPRRCSPALLASMLWSAAWTSDARPLTSPPSARARTCQKLLNLCIFLLNPLVHGDRIGKGAPDAERNGVSKAHPMGVQEMLAGDDDVPVKIASGTLDDVVTYMHIAIVVSASEDKGASLRWWTAAWNLAKELRLGREIGRNARSSRPEPFFLFDEQNDKDDEMNLDSRDMMSEEEREERRRVWWTLYLVDRHLALCYNRHLTILDADCAELLRPMDEMAWQEGVFEPQLQSRFSWDNPQTAGRFEFTGPSTFGYFLPISTVLGEIVDMHQRRMHPFLSVTTSPSGDLTGYDAEVRAICHQQLETFNKSMRLYQDRHIPPGTHNASDTGCRQQPLTEAQFQIATACAYGKHLMHVMYILLCDRWDPAMLLADNDMWTSSPSFGQAMNHALMGAEAVAEILRYDPQVGFMPYLYGIYLLQGSFLLLVTADRLATGAGEQMVVACETIVRAHEACVVTLNTEYQRAFRRCMQSALAQVRGRMPQDGGEQQRRRRETLSLYRWVGDGGGLAV